MPSKDPSLILAESLQSDPAISAETLFERFRIRWKFFVICAVVTPLIALALAHQIPLTYKSSAQILVRHQGGPLGLYRDLIPTLPLLSGATAAEVLRSDATASAMIEKVGVENDDIARPAYKVLFGKIAAWVMPLFGEDGSALSGEVAANPRLVFLLLAKELKPSVEATTLLVDRSSGTARDELIEVTVKSTNREKVAAMANGLCESFIAEYVRQSRVEIETAKLNLQSEADRINDRIKYLETVVPGARGGGEIFASEIREGRALASGMSQGVSALELALVQLRQTYTEGSREVVQAKAELEQARAILARQEQVDGAKDALNVVRRKLRECDSALELLKTDQTGMAVIERAIPPRKTKLATIIRYGVPAGAGLFAGVFLGLTGVLFLSLLDPRLFVAADASNAIGVPLLGVIHKKSAKLPQSADEVLNLPDKAARPALLQALGKLDVLEKGASHVVVVTSATNESSSSTVALQLSALLARDRERRVVLVDANFDRPELSESLGGVVGPGVLDALGGQADVTAVMRATKLPRLTFVSAGQLALRDEVGSSREAWERFLQSFTDANTTVVIHTGGLLDSREAGALAMRARRPILVTSRGVTRRDSLVRAAALLNEIGVPALGIVHCR